MRVLVVALLVFATSNAWAEQQTALIVNLSRAAPETSVLSRVQKDLRIAGYAHHPDRELRELLLAARPAGTTWSEEKAVLQAAQESYENFELGAALSALESFDRTWRLQAPSRQGLGLLGHRYLLGGLIRFAQGNESKARDNFRLSHRLLPSQESLSPGQYRPAVVELYARAVKENHDAAMVDLVFDIEQPSAELFVDGHRHEPGASITAGPHLIRLRAPGFQSVVRVDTITATRKLGIKLQALPGSQRIAALRGHDRDGPGVRELRELAGLGGAQLLVLLRDQGTNEVSVYRPSAQARGPWLRLGSSEWQSALRRDSPRAEVALDGTTDRTEATSAWYRTWWGGGALALGAGAAVGSVLYILLSPGAPDDGGVTIDQWCIGSCS